MRGGDMSSQNTPALGALFGVLGSILGRSIANTVTGRSSSRPELFVRVTALAVSVFLARQEALQQKGRE